MIASKFIKTLEGLIKKHGDLEICTDDEAWGILVLDKPHLVKKESDTYAGGRPFPSKDVIVFEMIEPP